MGGLSKAQIWDAILRATQYSDNFTSETLRMMVKAAKRKADAASIYSLRGQVDALKPLPENDSGKIMHELG